MRQSHRPFPPRTERCAFGREPPICAVARQVANRKFVRRAMPCWLRWLRHRVPLAPTTARAGAVVEATQSADHNSAKRIVMNGARSRTGIGIILRKKEVPERPNHRTVLTPIRNYPTQANSGLNGAPSKGMAAREQILQGIPGGRGTPNSPSPGLQDCILRAEMCRTMQELGLSTGVHARTAQKVCVSCAGDRR